MTDRESVRVKTLREIDTELRAKKLGYIDPAYLAAADPQIYNPDKSVKLADSTKLTDSATPVPQMGAAFSDSGVDATFRNFEPSRPTSLPSPSDREPVCPMCCKPIRRKRK